MQKVNHEHKEFKTGKDPLSRFIQKHFLLSHFICGFLLGIPFFTALEILSKIINN